jgi:hypothetical protein
MNIRSPTLGASETVVCVAARKNSNCQADGVQLYAVSCGGLTSLVTYTFQNNITRLSHT